MSDWKPELDAIIGARHGGQVDHVLGLLQKLDTRFPNVPEIAYQLAWTCDVLGREAEAVPTTSAPSRSVSLPTSSQVHSSDLAPRCVTPVNSPAPPKSSLRSRTVSRQPRIRRLPRPDASRPWRAQRSHQAPPPRSRRHQRGPRHHRLSARDPLSGEPALAPTKKAGSVEPALC